MTTNIDIRIGRWPIENRFYKIWEHIISNLLFCC